MSRKQMTIPGTGRKQNADVENAADMYRDARDERMKHSKLEKQRKLELIAVMQANKIKRYKFDDSEGEELEVSIDEKVDVSVRKTGEAESAIGEGVATPSDDGAIPRGLIEQAMKGQDDINVLESADGDVVVPEKSAPKAKGKKR